MGEEVIAETVKFEYNGKLLKGVADVGELKKHLASCSEFILSPEFPQSEDVKRNTKDFITTLLRQVGEVGAISEMYNEIMDLALDITVRKANSEATRPHFEAIGYCFMRIQENCIKNNTSLYEGLVKKFTYVLDNVQDETYLTMRFARPVVEDCILKTIGTSKEHVALLLEMIQALLKHPTDQCIDAAYQAMRGQAKIIKWKEHLEIGRQIFHLMCKVRFPDWVTKEEKKDGNGHLENVMEQFLEMIEKEKLTKELIDDMVDFVLQCMESCEPELFVLGKVVADKAHFNIKKDKALIMEITRHLTAALADDSHPWNTEREGWKLNGIAQDLIRNALDCVTDGKAFTLEEFDELIGLARLCQQHDCIHPVIQSAVSVTFVIYCIVGSKVISWLDTLNELQRVHPLVLGFLNLLQTDDDNVQTVVGAHMTIVSRKSNLLAPHLDKLIAMFLDNERSDILAVIDNSYQHNQDAIVDHFQALFEHLDSGNSSIRSTMILLIQKVAKFQPDLFTDENMQTLIKEAKEDNSHQTSLLQAVEEIGKRRPEKFAPLVNDLMSLGQWQSTSIPLINRMLQVYAFRSEESAQKILDCMMIQIQNPKDKSSAVSAFSAARLIGYKYRSCILKYRSIFENVRDKTSDDDYHTACVFILDMLDGKSVDKIVEELKLLQDDVKDLDIRVVNAETTVSEVKDTVSRQGEEMQNVKSNIKEQSQRLDQIQETVEETVVKVEEIDGKTLSHAPFWSRDLSKLLNPAAEHDWRLLTQRLGYSKDDIRGWAQQSDPCMAMLNEWYATHKTREATFGVLTALQDMNREDAAAIVENAMKSAEAVVEDEDFEYARPPDVFLSYQWGHQNEVQLLRQHLEMAGYSCWMDVGQMGGGDKLFEKIDAGIRCAKVVISCVNEKYSRSPNCNREVTLSVSLGKPIIPLLMENTTWPPPGSMGPIFSEYLFIRFFQRSGEETKDQRYWPEAKFQELLMQLSMNSVIPNETVIQPEYKDWWLPKIDKVKIDKNRSRQQNTQSTPIMPVSNKEIESPEVFLSYQWAKQAQILGLYRVLTSLGFTCWLDIMQMGGGDSLYDKIDRGLRGCRVVISCVTSKYALSANCRREVSLADALKKSIVPLLLEASSWPPPGPMGPVFTQLLYIDCASDPSVQETWEGPKFDELVSKISEHVSPKERKTMAPEGKQTVVSEERKTVAPEEKQTVVSEERKTVAPEEKQTVVSEERKAVTPVGQQPTHHLSNTYSHISPHKDEKQQTTIEDQNTVKGKIATPAPYNTVKENRIDQKQEGRRDWQKRDSKVSIASSTYSEIYGHDAYNSANNDMDIPRYGMMASQPKVSACCSIL